MAREGLNSANAMTPVAAIKRLKMITSAPPPLLFPDDKRGYVALRAPVLPSTIVVKQDRTVVCDTATVVRIFDRDRSVVTRPQPLRDGLGA